jgi:hypothetical protein
MEKTHFVHHFSTRRRRSSNDTKINPFNIGRRQNWIQVMGPEPLKWFLPIRNSLGNGVAFPINEDVRGLFQEMRRDQERVNNLTTIEDEEDNRVWTRDETGRWTRHD